MALTTVNPGLLDSQAQYTGFKNRLINGQMMIDQRNAGAAVSIDNAGTYTVDRWAVQEVTDGVLSVQQVTTAPAGFKNSLKITVTTADSSLSAAQYANIRQPIEGVNVVDLAFGSASASSVTVSFWVQCSLTGTFGGALANSAENRSYPFTYTISSANTWEYKTVTIAGDTSGTWLTDTGVGLWVVFGLGVGSDRSGTAGSWAAAGYRSATGAVNVVGTNGATFYITGVQLEKGSTATSFDYRPYGTELALCQRYFSRITGSNVAFGSGSAGSASNTQFYVVYPQTMRASPTITLSSTQVTDFQNAFSATTVNGTFAGLSSAQINVSSSGLTQYRPYLLTGVSASSYIEYSVEL